MAEFDIKQLAAKAHFDYVGTPFPLFIGQQFSGAKIPDLKTINAELLNGGQYFMRVQFKHQGEVFTLPNEPIVALSLAKTIVETATVGTLRKGTVKEYITTEDYQIGFRGICVDEEDLERYPSEQVETLNRLFEINEAIEVVNNKFFELFGIRNIVLKDIQFDEMVGQPGMQRYAMFGVSDQDFYADLNEKGRTSINVLS